MQSQRYKTMPSKADMAMLGDFDTRVVEKVTESTDESVIRTFEPDELQVSLVNEDGTTEIRDVRGMIASRDCDGNGTHIILLSNHRIYIVNSLYSKEVRWNQELGYEVKELKTFVGDKLSLLTKENTSLVAAINEVYKYASTSRKLVGSIQYVVESENQLPTRAEDMAYCFRLDTKRFYYYSEGLEDWIVLPKGWAKLNHIVRTRDNLPECSLNDMIGVLEESVVLRVAELDETISFYSDTIDDNVGDEYLCDNIITKNKSGKGSLVLTERGWMIIFQ